MIARSICSVAVTALLLLAGVPAEDARAGNFRVLYSFTGGHDGGRPLAGLLMGKNGVLLGTAFDGGLDNRGCRQNDVGCGVVFSISRSGVETVMYSFQGEGRQDGSYPAAGLIADSSGNLFGTTAYGGIGGRGGNGTVFAIGSDGQETILHDFAGGRTDGKNPAAGLVRDAAGNLYGTTQVGGMHHSYGTVFKITPAGDESVLHAFKGGADGEEPDGGLVLDDAGNLFGTTFWGGGANCGTVFEITPDGTETIAYAFQGGSDGCNPWAGLSTDAKGNLYGTTVRGGGSGCDGYGCGTVFRLSAGSVTTTYSFKGGDDGANPQAGIIAVNGDIYGTTFDGGGKGSCDGGCGVVFEIGVKGEKILHAFTGGKDGAQPKAALVAGPNGHVFGTASAGGAGGAGTVFETSN